MDAEAGGAGDIGAPEKGKEQNKPAEGGAAGDGGAPETVITTPVLSSGFKLDLGKTGLPIVKPLTNDGPVANVNALGPLANVGFILSKFILIIISAYVPFLIIYLLHMSMSNANSFDINSIAQISDSTVFNRNLNLFKAIEETNKAKRDFVAQTSQMVLLNLLLPTLTAILGYIFGSAKGESKTN